jgi:hypothetical protein
MGPRGITFLRTEWLNKTLVTDKRVRPKEYCAFKLLKERDVAARRAKRDAKMAAQAAIYVDPGLGPVGVLSFHILADNKIGTSRGSAMTKFRAFFQDQDGS